MKKLLRRHPKVTDDNVTERNYRFSESVDVDEDYKTIAMLLSYKKKPPPLPEAPRKTPEAKRRDGIPRRTHRQHSNNSFDRSSGISAADIISAADSMNSIKDEENNEEKGDKTGHLYCRSCSLRQTSIASSLASNETASSSEVSIYFHALVFF